MQHAFTATPTIARGIGATHKDSHGQKSGVGLKAAAIPYREEVICIVCLLLCSALITSDVKSSWFVALLMRRV
jgi:hypothetical protein